MKKLHKLAAAVAVAAGIALSPQSQAIELETNGLGDALLFPVFASGAGLYENYFTVSNSSANWIQGHLRFRGAAWSAELLDFDVILSPGDVFVFRLADVDGDGAWEVDGRLDPRNFQYTGMVFQCTTPNGTVVSPCINASNLLEPNAAGITQARNAGITDIEQKIAAQRTWGYVEFIGEAVLNGMTDAIMNTLIGDNPGAWRPYVTENGNGRGTNTWRWSDAQNGFRTCPAEQCDRGLSDVPSILSGTAFITMPGQVSGLAYNAEALIDFRTGGYPHRINNYPPFVAARNAVILHEESAARPANGTSPFGDYIYGCCNAATDENRGDEAVISFNNTWGPTLADGDDYLPTDINTGSVSLIPGLPGLAGSIANTQFAFPIVDARGDDAFDRIRRNELLYGNSGAFITNTWEPYHNSISEVEMAIRNASVGQNDAFVNLPNALRGQMFTSYYFDNDTFDKSTQTGGGNLNSTFLGFFPTKFFYREVITSGTGYLTFRGAPNAQQYINDSVVYMLRNLSKPINVSVWDINEHPCTCTNAAISPARSESCDRALGHELNVWDIDWLKQSFTDANCPNYRAGRTEVWLRTVTSASPLDQVGVSDGYPGLLYTFEMTNTGNLAHWRPMQKH